MVTITRQKLKLISLPYERRPALVPMRIAVALAWILVFLTIPVSISMIRVSPLWGWFSLMVVLGFAAYAFFVTYKWAKDSDMRFELSIDGGLLRLSSYDKHNRTRVKDEISLGQVKTAEYFEPQDTASLLLRGDEKSLEIPLWSFGPDATQKLVDYVREAGIRIVGNRNDLRLSSSKK